MARYVITVKPVSSDCVSCVVLVTYAHAAKDGTGASPDMDRQPQSKPDEPLNGAGNLPAAVDDDTNHEFSQAKKEKQVIWAPCKVYNSF